MMLALGSQGIPFVKHLYRSVKDRRIEPQGAVKASPERFDSSRRNASGIGAEMNGNCENSEEKPAKWDGLFHFRAAARKISLTLWGCQLNVGLNSEKFTQRETNAPHGVVRALHVGLFERICVMFLEPSGSGLFCFF
jgi:hypothetical protein